ncbi:MAG: hypothetical protein AAFX39_11065 [Pseudomonadota bacterium]
MTKFQSGRIRKIVTALGWSAVAIGIASLTGLAAVTERGQDRIADLRSGDAFAETPGNTDAGLSGPDLAWLTREISRLRAETQRIDEERGVLADQLAALEAELGPVTGSIPSETQAPDARPLTAPSDPDMPAPPSAGPISDLDGSVRVTYSPLPVADLDDAASLEAAQDAVDADLAGMASADAQTTIPRQTQTRFGVDLGTATSLEAARGIWQALSSAFPGLLGALDPVIAIEEDLDAGLRLKLLAGPFVNAADAARLCEELRNRGVGCSAAPFDGQQLAVR